MAIGHSKCLPLSAAHQVSRSGARLRLDVLTCTPGRHTKDQARRPPNSPANRVRDWLGPV